MAQAGGVVPFALDAQGAPMTMPPTVALADRIVARPNPAAPLKLLMFHHAGGSAAAVLPLARLLPADVEVTAFELAGRGVRTHDRPAATFAAARDELLDKVRASLDRPAVPFGHSLGAMLASSVSRRLAGREQGLIRRVILSGCPLLPPAPAGWRPPERTLQSLRDELAGYGGTPAEILGAPGAADFFARLLGQDLRLVDTAALETDPAPPALDYEIWLGHSDHTAHLGQPEQWRAILPRPPVVRYFGGGHFYLFDESAAAAMVLDEVIAAELKGLSPPGPPAAR